MPSSCRSVVQWVFVALLVACMSSVAGAEVPLADFAKHMQFREVRISPDGDHLVARAVVDDTSVLALLDLKTMKLVNSGMPRGMDVTGLWWVGPETVMYSLGERFGALEQPEPTGELYTINADGSGSKIIYGVRAGEQQTGSHVAKRQAAKAAAIPFEHQPYDPGKALITVYPFLGSVIGGRLTVGSSGMITEAHRIDTASGRTTKLAVSPIVNGQFIADNEGHVRFVYAVDADQSLKVWYRADDDKPWEKLFDSVKDKRSLQPLLFNRDDSAVYFDCDEGRDAGGVCLWDVATRKFKTLWTGTDAALERLLPTFDGKDAFAIVSLAGRPAVALIDKNSPEAKLLIATMQQFPGEDVDFVNASRDGKKVLIKIDADVDPGRYYLYDADSHKTQFLFARANWIKPEQMASQEPITINARDNLVLNGYLTRPAGKKDAKNLPLVVYVHGGPYGVRDSWGYDPYVQMLASRGYGVLQVNYRGSGGYGQQFIERGYREWGGKMQDDVTDATRWAIKQGIADPKRICIFGGSYGGYAALEGVVKEPDLYQCAIGYVGVYDLRLMYTRGDIPQTKSGVGYLGMVLGGNMDQLADRSPINHIDRIKAKLMLIVGGQDERVPPIQGENLHKALEEHHIPHVWLYQRTEGHGFYDQANLTDLFTRVIAFLDQNIGAKKGAAGKPGGDAN